MGSFNGKLRDELLDGELFNCLAEARVLIEQWRVHYNSKRVIKAASGCGFGTWAQFSPKC